MALVVKDWKDSPDTTTPLSAAAMEDLETRLGAYADTLFADLSYVEFTSAVVVTATTEAGADTVVTAAAVSISSGQSIWVEFFAPEANISPSAAGTLLRLALYDGSSSIGMIGDLRTPVASNFIGAPVHVRRKLSPSVASHTYSIRAFATAAIVGANINAGAGGSGNRQPGYIRVRPA